MSLFLFCLFILFSICLSLSSLLTRKEYSEWVTIIWSTICSHFLLQVNKLASWCMHPLCQFSWWSPFWVVIINNLNMLTKITLMILPTPYSSPPIYPHPCHMNLQFPSTETKTSPALLMLGLVIWHNLANRINGFKSSFAAGLVPLLLPLPWKTHPRELSVMRDPCSRPEPAPDLESSPAEPSLDHWTTANLQMWEKKNVCGCMPLILEVLC